MPGPVGWPGKNPSKEARGRGRFVSDIERFRDKFSQCRGE
ncbi:hypothetical protein HNR65_000127 [Desulfosalsimonas propionicica]|uniref:Uncharacterized protein n=1 Tax=Desulfosalsimonas propionicica TaxID=332175 RepID=A0A7W0C6A4_9BACT|nr:hypothetical protein [Desulfosalsimonas propionicica]